MNKYGIGFITLVFTLLISGCGDKAAQKTSEADSAKTEQQAQKEYQPPSTPVQVSGQQSSQVLDIKGIKMLMPQAKATELIVSNLKNQNQGACKLLNLGPNQIELWQIGDQALVCGNGNFRFFDREVPEVIAIFDDGKLALLLLKDLRGNGDGGKPPLPDFYRALADKFGVKPEQKLVNTAVKGEDRFVSSFFGMDGAELEVTGDVSNFADGQASFSHVTLSFYEPDYDKKVAERLKLIKENQNKAQQAQGVKQKKDL